MAAEWRTEAKNGKMEESENKIALLLSDLTDLLTKWIAQQEDIHSLDDMVQQHRRALDNRLQQLEQTIATPVASSSNTSDRLEALEIDVGSLKDDVQLQHTATQQLEQRICTAAANPSSGRRESTPKFDGQEIFCDSTKTDPILWFRKFELKLQLYLVSEYKHHTYLYSRSGGACQAWMDNLLSKYGVVTAELHTKISWDDLKAAWHKRFQVEPPEIKAMDKLMVFEQAANPSSGQRESTPKFDGQEIFCDSTKTNPIPWFCKFELILQFHQVSKYKHHTYLYSRSGGPCQAWMDNLLSKYGVVAVELHTKIRWDDLKAACHKRFQVEPAEIKAMDKLMTFEQGEPVTFDILDTDFNIILGMPWLASADHRVNFHRRTLTVRDAFGAKVACTIPLPHPLIRCQVVTTKSFQATCAYEQPEEIDLCFLRTVAVANSSPTDLSSYPRVVRFLDKFADIFESPTGVVPDRPISH
ncbi:hypothetical protein CBR_g74620 [Chara braunii]|uniref:Uncharacterized protein n=1 Tax=Chara braunii TaxID=69332 RepID=A0A388KAG5_CHABU|nr:hypothetical protein CBR_g74620 [Chara braunii]|eukprot:GBG66933.1 hypothetical protein CBR_g74620 [Chara braunii]